MPQDRPPGSLNEATRAFGDRVRERRNELGISQETAADRISIHWSALGKIERGQRSLRLETILKIAAGLEIDPGELIKGLPVPEVPED
jgi:transcriptional regulator with XRE-family HTH domain